MKDNTRKLEIIDVKKYNMYFPSIFIESCTVSIVDWSVLPHQCYRTS